MVVVSAGRVAARSQARALAHTWKNVGTQREERLNLSPPAARLI